MSVTLYRIMVNSRNGTATVTREPDKRRFTQNKDDIKFVSNDQRTVIRYKSTSPCSQIPADQNFLVDSEKGPFTCVVVGDHVFECGRMLEDGFSKWAETNGDGTPVDGDAGGNG